MGIDPERIKQHNPILDVAERYYELVGRGNKRTVRDNKSIVFYLDTDSYHDFGSTGEGGSVIDLVMNRESLDFNAACDFLSGDITDATPVPARRPVTQNNTEFAENIKQQNRDALTPALATEGLRELYPFINDAAPFMHLLGYSHYNNSLTFELPGLSINRRAKNGNKWVATKGNNRNHIPYKINDSDKYVYLYSGMAEIIACEAMGVSYIGLQMDSSDSHITDIKSKVQDKTLVVIEENDESSQKLSQRLRNQFQQIKIIKIGENKSYGYDLRDFVIDTGSFELSRVMLDKLSDMLPLQEILVQDEIVIPYNGDYIASNEVLDVSTLDKCVIVAKTGDGKTYSFENKPGVMILVPRVLQTDTGKGDDTDYVMNKIMSEGATLTFEKFIGHYNNRFSGEFKHYVDTNRFKVIVDEAHMIQTLKPGYEIIYGLDAVFMSGTLEKFFRQDLQRYKFKPSQPTVLHYTNGELPDIANALYFADRPKPLMRNYPKNCVVGAEHKFNNFNVHQHTYGKVLSTSALREGISINTGTFDACVVDASLCSLWSVKDAIQAMNRPRGDNVLRILTKPVESSPSVFADFNYYMDKARSLTDTKEINTIMGEEYSNFIKKTHKHSRYMAATEFGVVCYLADKTRDMYDSDLYVFEEYVPEDTFEIDTEIDPNDEVVEMLQHKIGEDVYEYPSNKREPFMRWARHKESGLVDRMAKMTDAKSMHAIYTNSRVAHELKAKYNKTFNRGKNKRAYSMKLFYKLMSNVVQLEMSYEGEKIERVSKHKKLSLLGVKVVSECPIEGVTKISNLRLDNYYNKREALNCTANAHHSAKTANKVGRPTIAPEIALKSDENRPTNTTVSEADFTLVIEDDIPPDKTDKYAMANEAFFDDISELEITYKGD